MSSKARARKLVEVKALPPAEYEPYALELAYEDGSRRKFVLDEDRSQAFARKAWEAAALTRDGSEVSFGNGERLSAGELRKLSKAWVQPEFSGRTILSNGDVIVKETWKWPAKYIGVDAQTDLLKILIDGRHFEDGTCTFASPDTGVLSHLVFDAIDDFNCGIAVAKLHDGRVGYINKDLQFVVPPIFASADGCSEDVAFAKKPDGTNCLVKPDGSVIELPLKNAVFDYFGDGRGKFSVRPDLGGYDTDNLSRMAYYHEHATEAGAWGYVDGGGRIVIEPQYIFASNFHGDVAVVAKGRWETREEWGGKVWRESDLWGVINAKGEEVIPCRFDEIEDVNGKWNLFWVHEGGWKKGAWGVMDSKGRWVIEPRFSECGYNSCGRYLLFLEDGKRGPGVIDMQTQKVTLAAGTHAVVEVIEEDKEGLFITRDRVGDEIVEQLVDFSGKRIEPPEAFRGHCEVGKLASDRAEFWEPDPVNANRKLFGIFEPKTGKVLLPASIPADGACWWESEQILRFWKGEDLGAVSIDGRILAEPRYGAVDLIPEIGFACVTKSGRTDFISRDGRKLGAVGRKLEHLTGKYFVSGGKGGIKTIFEIEIASGASDMTDPGQAVNE